MAEANNNNKLHVVMFPWLAFGHILPYLHLAKLIAQKGHRVSFISTPRNIQRLPNLPPNLSPLINFVKFPLPHRQSSNLPENAESTMDVPPHIVPSLKAASDALRGPVSLFLESTSADWIIYDFAYYWVPPIAANLRLSSALFTPFNACSVSFFGPPSSFIHGDASRREPRDFTVPPPWVTFPSTIAFRLYESKRFFSFIEGVSSGVSDMFRFGKAIAGADAYLTRGCAEIDGHWMSLLSEICRKPVVPVGLMPRPVDDEGEGDTWLEIKGWLDRQVKGSVVYVALGSEVALSREEQTELALGLELAGLPFFWALRKKRRSSSSTHQEQGTESDSAELPDGFEERTRGQGVVWAGWVPQLRVVSHESVGGFLTHCGWSSVIEGLQFGRPLVMLPILGDQTLNARAVGQGELGVGMEIGREGEEEGWLGRDSVARTVKWVIEGEEGRACREKAMAMREIFGNHDLQAKYTDEFVGYLESHLP